MGCGCSKPGVSDEPLPTPRYKSSRQSSSRYSARCSPKGSFSQSLSGLLSEKPEKENRRPQLYDQPNQQYQQQQQIEQHIQQQLHQQLLEQHQLQEQEKLQHQHPKQQQNPQHQQQGPTQELHQQQGPTQELYQQLLQYQHIQHQEHPHNPNPRHRHRHQYSNDYKLLESPHPPQLKLQPQPQPQHLRHYRTQIQEQKDDEQPQDVVPVKVPSRRRQTTYYPDPSKQHIEVEQIGAGWPAWLSTYAAEAIHGWIPRCADSFEKLDKIGQGTYSTVYRARDLETRKIVALKKVRFDNLEPESVKFMAREIVVLRRLNHPNVIKLEGLVTSRMSSSVYLVFEYMEHDLAGLAAYPGIIFSESQVKCYLRQLLLGLEHCHTHGVLHRDIKGANLLIDNSGILKIADFGLATVIKNDGNQALTHRVVTLWYRPPELLLGATKYGAAVDLWSTGCILAELLAGRPIMPGRTEVEQLHKIFKLCGSPSDDYWKRNEDTLPDATMFKPQQHYKRCIVETFRRFPASALALLDVLLAIEPSERGTATEALNSEFFTTPPYACNPSTLPKYPPSKELDAKIRDEEYWRQRRMLQGAAANPGRDRQSKPVHEPAANPESLKHMQRMASHSGLMVSHADNPQVDQQSAIPHGRRQPATSSMSGPLGPPGARKKKSNVDDVRMAPPRLHHPHMSTFEFTSQSGDLSHLSSVLAANKNAALRDAQAHSRDGSEIGRQRRLVEEFVPGFSESFRIPVSLSRKHIGSSTLRR